jgi:hypothetical protein
MRVFEEFPYLKRNIGLLEGEILTMVYQKHFKKPSVVRLHD